ncbi:LysR family transcriptional regulator [Streptomyces sp. NPDC001985]|uniref:LysR family transcriptional regulator n=1 Tax=Streptomyces sp. NPDC001985 TaxID=3154406 RepID=UPI0033252E93
MYQLRTFREVARLGSFTKAARSLGYAQSSISAHIRALESRIGFQLIQRLPHGVRLTAAGEIFNDHAVRIFQVMEEMASALNPSGGTAGRVSVGASALLLESRVSSLVRECRYRYPNVRLSPRQLAIGCTAEAVRAGQVDMALVHGDYGERTPLPGGVTVRELPPLDVVPVGPATFATEAREKGAGRALATARVLVVDPDCASHRVLVSAVRELYGVDPPTVEAGSVGGARELARSGYGIAMLPAETMCRGDECYGLTVLAGLPRVRLGVRALWAGQDLALSAVGAVCKIAERIGREQEAEFV